MWLVLEPLIILGTCFGIRLWSGVSKGKNEQAASGCGLNFMVALNDGALLAAGGLLLEMASPCLPITSIAMLIGQDLKLVETILSKCIAGILFIVLNKIFDMRVKIDKDGSCKDPSFKTILVSLILYAIMWVLHVSINIFDDRR